MATTHFSGPVDSEQGFSVNGTTIITAAGAITADIQASAGSIGTAELANASVTGAKLASSVSTVASTATPALSPEGATEINATANAVNATLAAGTFVGQVKVIVMTAGSNSSTVTIANHQTSDPEVATFDAVDETGVFMWTGTEWITIFATCTFV